jgi:hypothetical protein
MGKSKLKKLFYMTCLFIVPIAIFACVNLKAIRQFADVSADTTGYASLTTDYVNSFEVLKKYEPKDMQAELDKRSKERKDQQKALMALHQGVKEYMYALGSLASDELVSYDKSLDSLTSEMKTAKLFDEKQINAYSALTRIILKASTDAYRQRQLGQIIGESNSDLQLLLNAMQTIVEKAFVSSLENEVTALNKFYQNVITAAEKAPPQQAAIQLLRESSETKRDAIIGKQQSCSLYVQTLKKIRDGHQLLYDSRDDLSSKRVLDTIYSYGRDIEILNKSLTELRQ